MKKFLFLLSNNLKVLTEKECLKVEKNDKKFLIPYSYIEQIVIFSFVPVSSKVFQKLSQYGITYHIMSKHGIYIGSYYPSFF